MGVKQNDRDSVSCVMNIVRILSPAHHMCDVMFIRLAPDMSLV